jgi:hypothetical protein
MANAARTVRFILALALALSASTAFADDRCGEGMRWDGRGCAIEVIGIVQRPQVFTLTGRSALGWTAIEQRTQSHSGAVVAATRRAPF